MSLRTKFAILLAILALTVLGGAGAAAWSFGLVQREISEPFATTTRILRGLSDIKRGAEERATLLLGPAGWPGPDAPADGATPQGVRGSRAGRDTPLSREERERFEALARGAMEAIDELEAAPGWRVRAGIQAGGLLRQELQRADASVRAWMQGGGDAALHEAGTEFFSIHELIERLERRIISDARLAVDFAARLRQRLLAILGFTIGIAVMVGLLGQALVSRWVLRPVAALRTAAVRIGAGDYGHRVEVDGSDEVAQLAGEVNHMASTIGAMQEERIQREKLAAVGEMVRRLAHNIRNPLSGIRGLAELTRADLPSESDLRENQQRIIESVDRFEHWLSDLLKATRPAEVQPRPTPVREWLTRLVESHRAMAQARRVSLEVQFDGAPDEAMLDPQHLEHALVAILANAISASPGGGIVRVTARVGPNTHWEIEIRDQGPGVPLELRERIFQPYFTTKRDGTGIGLALAQQAIRAHGGVIRVDGLCRKPEEPARADTGAVFTVRLPVSPAIGENVANTGQVSGVRSGESFGHRG